MSKYDDATRERVLHEARETLRQLDAMTFSSEPVPPPEPESRLAKFRRELAEQEAAERAEAEASELAAPRSLVHDTRAELDGLRGHVLNLAKGSAACLEGESGLLITPNRTVAPEGARRIWGDEGGYRIFLRHKSEVKAEAGQLQEDLKLFGVSGFVAHKEIHPTRAWQDEIENALHSMDAFVAGMTKDFHDSDWTDQEVGIALARGVPVIALRLGRDPYGFLGKFQALSTDWAHAPEDIVKVLVKHDRMLSAYLNAMRNCTSFDNGNRLSRILPSIERLSEPQIDQLDDRFHETTQYGPRFRACKLRSFRLAHMIRILEAPD
jgi:hypothetical protein